jgi:hypothetical protein
VYIDIGSDVSDIMLVTNGIPAQFVSVPFGKHTLLRAFARATGTAGAHAQSLCLLYQEGKLLREDARAMDAQMTRVLDECRAHFADAIRGCNAASLPETLLLATDVDCSRWFVELFASDVFAQVIGLHTKSKVIHITPYFFGSRVTIGEQGNPDTLLLLLAASRPLLH